MSYLENALKMRPYMEKAVSSLTDADALEVPTMFPKWAVNVHYTVGDRVQHRGALYKVLQTHTSQDAWAPDAACSLFAKVLIPDTEAIHKWEQPASTNPYMAGDKVTHNGKTWTSAIDHNVWEPGVYGWTENQ